MVPRSFGLNKQVRAWIDRQPSAPRSWGFHPSEMARLCPVLHVVASEEREHLAGHDPTRATAAAEFWSRLTRIAKADAGLQLEFDLGHIFHDVVKHYLGSIGVLWGQWRCSLCWHSPPVGLMPRTTVPDIDGLPIHAAAPCPVCVGRNLGLAHPWSYVETGIAPTKRALEWGFDGHVDGDLRLPFDGRTVRATLEIKSINKENFAGRYGGPLPKPEHVMQASLYAWCLEIDYLCIVYICKDQAREWKEFVVPVDMGAVAQATAKIAAVREARARGVLPLAHRVCPDPREPRARACPARARCFPGVATHENFLSAPGAGVGSAGG